MKIGDVVKVTDADALSEQDWWDAISYYKTIDDIVIPIVESTVGTIVGQDTDNSFVVDFNVMIPVKLRLYFSTREMKEMK